MKQHRNQPLADHEDCLVEALKVFEAFRNLGFGHQMQPVLVVDFFLGGLTDDSVEKLLVQEAGISQAFQYLGFRRQQMTSYPELMGSLLGDPSFLGKHHHHQDRVCCSSLLDAMEATLFGIVAGDWPTAGNHLALTLMGNPDLAGAGGLLPDGNGQWISGFARNIGFTSAVLAELWGALTGLEHTWSLGFKKTILEVNSEMVYKLVSSSGRSALHVSPLVESRI
ncbi:hypothetical protein CRG98_013624 [Punica granatum]|uniref:RNase H type-1 domain-containing protein n=1 Tax=Punica granatum TaxID=22663 RepID=A0A2I0KBQ5_PUNGR|nr:hypothetical protein CRG98_013624 [Punica granatum]